MVGLVYLVYLVGPVDKMDQRDLLDQIDYFLIPAVAATLDGTAVWRAAPQE
jgi:hypothetical protein